MYIYFTERDYTQVETFRGWVRHVVGLSLVQVLT